MSTTLFPITRSLEVIDCGFPVRALNVLKGMQARTVGDVLDFARVDDHALHEQVYKLGFDRYCWAGSSFRRLRRVKGCGNTTLDLIAVRILELAKQELLMIGDRIALANEKVRAVQKLRTAIENEEWAEAIACCETLKSFT